VSTPVLLSSCQTAMMRMGETHRRRKDTREERVRLRRGRVEGVAAGAASEVVDMGTMSTELLHLNQLEHSTFGDRFR